MCLNVRLVFFSVAGMQWGVTPLMLAVKENNKEKQDYKEVVRYFVKDAIANVNQQAKKASS